MVVNIQYCQLSNRLVIIAHAMATAIANHRPLLLTVFEDLKEKYKCEVRWGGRVTMRRSVFWSVEKKLWGVWRRIFGYRRIPGVISDWRYRDRDAVCRYHDFLISFFTPRSEIIRYALEFESRNFRAGEVRIGVHVRRGDYATWKGGRYWYDDTVYLNVMKTLREELEGETVLFILFSNDISCNTLLKRCLSEGLQVTQSSGSPFDDHYLMSRCDFLVGPPSTFTLWASWFGKVPLCHIRNVEHRPLLSEFKWNAEC